MRFLGSVECRGGGTIVTKPKVIKCDNNSTLMANKELIVDTVVENRLLCCFSIISIYATAEKAKNGSLTEL